MKQILLSIGTTHKKKYLLPFIAEASKNPDVVFLATEHTHAFLQKHKIHSQLVYKISQATKQPNISRLLAKRIFDVIITIPSKKKGEKLEESTDGEIIRKTAIDQGIIPITTVDVAEIILSNIAGDEENKIRHPYYDPLKTYKFNYEYGPFSAFADGKIYVQKGKPKLSFLGQKVFLPFGIASGPLLNSNYAKAGFEKGFDLCVYKTVRTTVYPSHPFPNVLSVHIDGNLTIEKISRPILADSNFNTSSLSITNSFGVPSKDPCIWQKDIKKALGYQGLGQLLIVSFMGTTRQDQTQEEFFEDFVMAAKLSKATGAKVLEVNLSCPNIGNAGLVCYSIDTTKAILSKIRKVIGKTPLIAKIGYFENDEKLEEIARVVNTYAQAIAAVNTMQATIVDSVAKYQAHPGKNRVRVGVGGSTVKWAGIDMVKRLTKIKKKYKYSYEIVGVGGVKTPNDYKKYRKAGADAIMSATGSIWNPYLAQEIKKTQK